MLHFDCKRGLKRAKKTVLSPFNMFHKPLKTDTARSSSNSPSNSTLQTSTSNNNNNIDEDDNSNRDRDNNSSNNNNNNARKVGSYLLCCLCMSKKAQSVDISSDGIDPNDPNVSYGSLKSLLENNDFYSEECNTHLLP